MKLTGDTIFVQGRKLYERTDRMYQDDRGRVFDYRGRGKLYEQRAPGIWFWIRPKPEPRLSADVDSILDQAEGINL